MRPVITLEQFMMEPHQQRFRVGTFNVHGFTNGNSEDTFEEICDLLSQSNLDIIGLQEAPGARLSELMEKIGKDKYQLAAKYGGTAIVTRLPIIKGSGNKPGKGRFCCCEVVLPTNGDSIRTCSIIVLHLDHRKEIRRLNEMKTVIKAFEKCGSRLPDIWVGDFNALTRSDYSRKEWNQIAQIRQQSHWEPPISDLTSDIKATMKKKTPLWKGMGLNDAFESAPATRRRGPLGTSRFDTRIDYVYFNEQRLRDAGWTISTCEHVDSKKFSDHNLVVATFQE